MNLKVGDYLKYRFGNHFVQIIEINELDKSYKLQSLGLNVSAWYDQNCLDKSYITCERQNVPWLKDELKTICDCGKEKHGFFSHSHWCSINQ